MYSCEVQRWFLLFFSFLRVRFELCERSVTFHSRTDGFGVTCQWFCNNRPQNPKTQMLTLAFPQPHRHGLMSAALLCSHWQRGRGLYRLAALLSTSSSQKVVDSSPHRCNLFSKLSFLVAGGGNVIYFCFSFLTSPQQAPKELKQTLRMGKLSVLVMLHATLCFPKELYVHHNAIGPVIQVGLSSVVFSFH